MNTYEILHQPFDIEIHKNVFTNYLEVIIHDDGKISYAVPSHQEYLIGYLMNKLGKSRHEVNMMCPREYWCDFITWLCKETGCISVWNEYYIGTANKKQMNALRKLKMNGLYKGSINKRE